MYSKYHVNDTFKLKTGKTQSKWQITTIHHTKKNIEYILNCIDKKGELKIKETSIDDVLEKI